MPQSIDYQLFKIFKPNSYTYNYLCKNGVMKISSGQIFFRLKRYQSPFGAYLSYSAVESY